VVIYSPVEQLGAEWEVVECLFDITALSDPRMADYYGCSCLTNTCVVPTKIRYNEKLCPRDWRAGDDCYVSDCKDPESLNTGSTTSFRDQCSDYCPMFTQAEEDEFAAVTKKGMCPYAIFSDGTQCYDEMAPYNSLELDDGFCVVNIDPQIALSTADYFPFNGPSNGTIAFNNKQPGGTNFTLREAGWESGGLMCNNPMWTETGTVNPNPVPSQKCSCATWNEVERGYPTEFMVDRNVTDPYGVSYSEVPFLQLRGGCTQTNTSPNDRYCDGGEGGACSVEHCCFPTEAPYDEWTKWNTILVNDYNWTSTETCFAQNFLTFNTTSYQGEYEQGGGCVEAGFTPTAASMFTKCSSLNGGKCSICGCCTDSRPGQSAYELCLIGSGGYWGPGIST